MLSIFANDLLPENLNQQNKNKSKQTNKKNQSEEVVSSCNGRYKTEDTAKKKDNFFLVQQLNQ